MWLCQIASAAPHDLRIPLHDGRLDWTDLAAVASQGVHLPPFYGGKDEIDLRGWRGAVVLSALNAFCGDACRIGISRNSLDFHFDAQKLPVLVDHAKQAVRAYVATKYPEATVAQARHYGLFFPPAVDPAKPLVVLLHGLDCNIGILQPMGEMLEARGVQVAYFCYPSDQAIQPDVELLAQRLNDLHNAYPRLRIDLIGHSMGGLIARGYVEGNLYRGDVDRLIMVGTPNAGSRWTKYHLLLKVQKEWALFGNDPNWHWSWMVTDGLGEAARDLSPHSDFLRELNSLPRRQGVRYTVIAGSHSVLATFESEIAIDLARLAPQSSRQWWGVRQAEGTLSQAARNFACSTDDCDGPVSIGSALLPGVSDVVILPADHCGLFVGNEASPPASLPAILDRLGVVAATR